MTHHNPDDLHQRHHILTALRDQRLQRGLSQKAVAHMLHLTRAAVGRFETRGRDPHLWALHRYAHAVGHRLHMRLHLPGINLPDTPLRHQLKTARRTLRLTQAAVGARLDVANTVISAAERADHHHGRLSTYQRYARALGGTLLLDLQPLTDQHRKNDAP